MKAFFRESNIWRLIGVALMVAAAFIPHGAVVIVAFGKDNGWLPDSVTLTGIFALSGFVLLIFPTAREAWKSWRGGQGK